MSQSAPRHDWQSIRQEILRRIVSRDWKPGELVPGEVELAAEFGCARATVSRALREVAEAGLLERRRKAGTRVALNPVRKATLDIPITRVEIEQRGAAYGYVLLSVAREEPPVAILGRLGLDPGRALLHVRCVHMADGAAYAYEDRWVDETAVPAITAVDLARTSANEWLVTNAPYTDGDFAFEAVGADETDAAALGTRPGTALLVVRRTTWTGRDPITHVRLAYAPGHAMRTTT